MTYTLAWWDASLPTHRQACIGRGLGVAAYVDGDVVARNGGVDLRLAFHDSSGATFDLVDIPGSPKDVLGWSRRAADAIARRVYRAQYPGWRAFQGLGGSTDPQAIREFVAGEEAFHRDSWRQAEVHFSSALADDPNFWLAAWQLTLVRRWRRVPFERDLELLARRHGTELPNLYRELIAAQLEPDLGRRFAGYERVIRRFPDNGYALLLYADELFHRGPLVGIPLDSAVGLMKRAVRKDPYLDQAPGYDHIVWAPIFLGDQAAARDALNRRLDIGATTKVAGFSESLERARFLQLGYLERFSPWKAALVRWWKFRDPPLALLRQLSQYVRLGLSLDIPRSEHALGAILAARARDPGIRANGHQASGIANMAMGRPAAAAGQLDSAAALFATPLARLDAAEWRVVFPAVAWHGTLLPGSEDSERRLTALIADPALAGRAAWALAIAAYARGDTANGARWRARIAARPPTDMGTALLLTLLDGRIIAATGRPDDALSLTANLDGYASSQEAGDPFFRTTLYLSRAEWFARLGRIEDAKRTLRWYQNSDLEGWPEDLTQSGEVDGAASGIARLRLGELRLQSHDTADACPLLRRVKHLWSEAEPALAGLQAHTDSLLTRCNQ